MRRSLLLVLSLLLSSALVAPAGASEEGGSSDKKRKAQRAAVAHPAATSRPDDYRELLADKIPIGSSAWWEQMRREGRLGGETP
jgi:hypothetical protein